MATIKIEWDGVLEPDCVYRVYQDDILIADNLLMNNFELSDDSVDSGEHAYRVGEFHPPSGLEKYSTDVVVLTLKKSVPPSNLRVTLHYA